ncbi:MAG TPA: MYXO-CTERM sorting domain-containing protein, partial [Myxococcota bacterium]|nr:MYXO-CTERM sorting domain-containing protein [Myxococcota bacterium]
DCNDTDATLTDNCSGPGDSDPPTGDSDDGKDDETCGCASTTGGTGMAAVGGLLALGLLRRRRV